MLPADSRLRRSPDFARAVRRGRRGTATSLVVHLCTGTDAAPARVGFVVSKAVGGAVERNLVKRRLRSLVRERLPRLPAGALVVVRARPGAAVRGYPQLAEDLDRALARASSEQRRPAQAGRVAP